MAKRGSRRVTRCCAAIFFITAFIMDLVSCQHGGMVRLISVWVSNEFVIETQVSELNLYNLGITV